MKTWIHPEIKEITVNCSCWKKFKVKSVLVKNIKIEICSGCHPFYTWEQKILKTWAVDKYYARMKKTEQLKK